MKVDAIHDQMKQLENEIKSISTKVTLQEEVLIEKIKTALKLELETLTR
jgi:hypothetical protein